MLSDCLQGMDLHQEQKQDAMERYALAKLGSIAELLAQFHGSSNGTETSSLAILE